MCFQCGGGFWPWNHPVQLAPPPVKEEVIYLDDNPGFYADTRQNSPVDQVGGFVSQPEVDLTGTASNDSNSNLQGIHPPGQVWTSNQPAAQQYQYYNYPGAPTAPAGYFYNGQYPTMPTGTVYPNNFFYQPAAAPVPPAYYYTGPNMSSYNMYRNTHAFMPSVVPGGPSVLPMPTCPAAMSAQAAAALANNAALAAMPTAPSYWVGANPADHAAQQAIVAGMMGYEVKPQPTQLAPYKPADGQQFWCKELDGTWTLRTHSDIMKGEVSPGHWERHASSGYFYWIRHAV